MEEEEVAAAEGLVLVQVEEEEVAAAELLNQECRKLRVRSPSLIYQPLGLSGNLNVPNYIFTFVFRPFLKHGLNTSFGNFEITF